MTVGPVCQPEPKKRPNRRGVLEKRRRIALYFALALVFIRFSMIHQLLAFRFHIELYLLYWVGIPVIIGILATGSYKRVFQYRPVVYWTAFALWLIPSSIFSTWKGGSFDLVSTYYRTELIILFAIAALVYTWQECRWLIYTIAFAAVVNIAFVIFFGQRDENGRISLQFGTVSNSNDYAGHLIFVLPFILWIVMTTKSVWLRMAGFVVLAVGVYQILASASRGAMLGLVAAIVIFLFAAPSKLRRILLVAAPVILAVAFVLLPASAVHRIFSFSEKDSNNSKEALESSDIRKILLKDSIRFTFEHPLLGLGPGQFSANEGKHMIMPGQGFALWFQPHNSFTQISSENGFPALILYVVAIVFSLLLLNKTNHLCRGQSRLGEVTAVVLCLRIALTSFCVAIFFLNFGYFFYLPAMMGITSAVAASARQFLAESTIHKKKGSSEQRDVLHGERGCTEHQESEPGVRAGGDGSDDHGNELWSDTWNKRGEV
jgi:O-antigen ligase